MPRPPSTTCCRWTTAARSGWTRPYRPSLTRGRTEFTYFGTVKRIPEGAAPDIKNKSFRITADVVVPKGNAQGVLVTQGGLSGGYALMFEKGKPGFYYNVANVAHYSIQAKEP